MWPRLSKVTATAAKAAAAAAADVDSYALQTLLLVTTAVCISATAVIKYGVELLEPLQSAKPAVPAICVPDDSITNPHTLEQSFCPADALFGPLTAAAAETLPIPSLSVDALAYQREHVAFTLKILLASRKAAAIFATETERLAVCRVLSAVHAADPRLSFRKWLVPYSRLLFVHFGADEDRVFQYIVAHPHLYAGMMVRTERDAWCWTMGCAGCNKPRHKIDTHNDEIRATFMYV